MVNGYPLGMFYVASSVSLLFHITRFQSFFFFTWMKKKKKKARVITKLLPDSFINPCRQKLIPHHAVLISRANAWAYFRNPKVAKLCLKYWLKKYLFFSDSSILYYMSHVITFNLFLIVAENFQFCWEYIPPYDKPITTTELCKQIYTGKTMSDSEEEIT
jgi:hypothetical protein